MQEGLPHDKWSTLAYHLQDYIKHLNSSTDAGTYAASNTYPAAPAVVPPVAVGGARSIPGFGTATPRPVSTKVTSSFHAAPVEERIV